MIARSGRVACVGDFGTPFDYCNLQVHSGAGPGLLNDIGALGSKWSILLEDTHQLLTQAADKISCVSDVDVILQVWLPSRRKGIAGCGSQCVRIIWTGHASDRQKAWQKKLGITRPEVEALLQNPDQVVPGDRGIRVAQGRRGNGLLRVAFYRRGRKL